ncbi:BglII/BstYI family type II restriction endonuclease [uncultured Bradyrhizobium sp.]|uniref:BglII/BstYI family type II restriction endonuclease n=1 Tax=uncultured Bradyrhizobium sp. TaxID=199684 RepID=UPI0035CAA729
MKYEIFSYRFAEEILQHDKHVQCWDEIIGAVIKAPVFVYPGKSKNKRLDVVQQLLNAYFDRKLAIECGWQFHPIATKILNSNLKADFRKEFNGLHVQTEVQFGNMSRWYSDIFKFQAAYSESLTQAAVSIVPMSSLGTRIDSNVAHFERAKRELPSANLSITLPILLIGVSIDEKTPVIDVSTANFSTLKDITGKGKLNNRWRIVNSYFEGKPINEVSEISPIGPTLDISDDEDEETE